MRIENIDVFRENKELDSKAVDARVGDAVFTVRGSHDYMYDDIPATNKKENTGTACAKKNRGNFFIKMNNKGELYNPLDSTHLNTSGRMQNNLPVWRYVRVPYTAFAHYAHFLKTRNSVFIVMAKRDMGI